jgi:uncharacterized repeat protein (TIGR01451 family)/fimbrial isopeptide formation D2 family protein
MGAAMRSIKRFVPSVAAFALSMGGVALVAGAPVSAGPSPFAVSVTPSSNPVGSNSQLTWTINVTNTGGFETDGVVLTDQVPNMTGLTLSSTVGNCTQSANLVTCNAEALPGGAAWTVTITGTVTAPNGTTLQNTANVSGNQAVQSFSSSATGSTLVSGPPAGSLADLTVNITAPSTATVGTSVSYQLTVNNVGGANAQGVTVQDTLPAGFGVSAMTVSGSSLFSCSTALPIVTCINGQVNTGSNATIWITATASGGIGSYTDTAAVNPTGFIVESNYGNNSTTSTMTLTAPAPPPNTFTITKTASVVGSVLPGEVQGPLSGQSDGQTVTYTIIGTNASTKKASGISITDQTSGLDAAHITATYKIGTGASTPCTVSTALVTCTNKSPALVLNGGQTMTVTVTAPVVALSGSVITDTAKITGTINNVGQSATASVSLTVRPPVDLTVTEQAACSPVVPPTTPPTFRARNTFCYQLSVYNSGLQNAVGVNPSFVTIREPLPAGVIYVGFFNPVPANGFTCAADASNVVTCQGGTLAGASSGSPGGTFADLQLNLIAPDVIGPITAITTVNPFNTIAESDYTNNSFTLTTPISTGIDLAVGQTVNFDPVAPSGTLVYTITVSNLGTQDTTGVQLQDLLPAGVRYRIATETTGTSHNFTCGPKGSGEVDCTGGVLAGTYANGGAVDAATITVTLFAPVAYGPVTNTLRVDPSNVIPEYNELNNINTLTTQVQIPTVIGTQGTYNEFTVGIAQTSPVTPTTAINGILTYTLTVSNWGSDAASNVTVQDFLPAGTRFRYANGAPLIGGNGGFVCSANGQVVTCTGGALTGWRTNAAPFNAAGNVGGQTTVEISVFAPNQPGFITDQADVNPGNAIPEADTTNDVATLGTNVQLGGGGVYIDLSLPNLTADESTVAPNGVLNYTLQAANTGSGDAFNVEVTDTIPAGSVFRSASDASPGAGAFTCSYSGGVVDCTGGTLPSGGGTRTIGISIFAPPSTGTAADQAQINPSRVIPESDYTNNTANLSVPVAVVGGGGVYIDLSIPTLTVSPTPSVTPGAFMQYSMTVQNSGSGDANNIEVQDTLPAGVTYVMSTVSAGNAFNCSASGSVVDCTGGTINHVSSATITITATAPQETNQTLLDQATVNPSQAIPESDYSNNTATVSNTVNSQIDLSVSYSISGSPSQNSSYDYTGSVTNNAPAGGSGETAGLGPIAPVQVHFTLPVGVIIEAVTAPSSGAGTWSCQTQQNPVNVVDCTGTNVPTGQTENFDITVFDTTSASVTNQSTMTVNPNGTIVESDNAGDTNNSATA